MKSTIKTILYEWKVRRLPKIISREIDLLNYARTKPVKIIVVTGFRRVGKTYLTRHLMKDAALCRCANTSLSE